MTKRSEKPKEEENIQHRILNRLEAIENRINAIETSLRKSSESKQMGWLILGVVVGGLMGISGNLWASYFMKAIEPHLSPSDWISIIIISTTGLSICIGFLAYLAYERIRE